MLKINVFWEMKRERVFLQNVEKTLLIHTNLRQYTIHLTVPHPGIKDLEESQRMDFEDNLYAVISSASVLGYYIGLQEGADIIQSLTSSDLPEKMLAAFGELVSSGIQQ